MYSKPELFSVGAAESLVAETDLPLVRPDSIPSLSRNTDEW
jgi:hypothetical protein